MRSREPGEDTFGLLRIAALRMRVIKSPSGSFTAIVAILPYQLDFTRPGIRPLEPRSRNAMRDNLCLR